MIFAPIEAGLAELVITRKHYLHRPCPISWAFGIFVDEKLKGVLTVGKPCSSTVCSGVCGKERAHDVYELNRLWLDDSLPYNSESKFIGACLRKLRLINPNMILVSYADTAQQHIGYVYQATNWIYTGTSTPWTDKLLDGRKVTRSLKHRYVWFANDYCFTHKHGLLCRILNPMRDRLLLKWLVLPNPKREQAGA